MKRILTALVLLTCLFGAGDAVWADAESDADKGWEAYESKDYATALKEWRPLAEQGNARAQFWLGVLYEHGRGVTQDKAEAAKWYRKSAEQGNADAQYWLGVLYGNGGEGVLQDRVAAHMWLNIAVANGDPRYFERDRVAGKLSSSELVEARERAKRCMESKYKDCEAEPKSWWKKLLD